MQFFSSRTTRSFVRSALPSSFSRQLPFSSLSSPRETIGPKKSWRAHSSSTRFLLPLPGPSSFLGGQRICQLSSDFLILVTLCQERESILLQSQSYHDFLDPDLGTLWVSHIPCLFDQESPSFTSFFCPACTGIELGPPPLPIFSVPQPPPSLFPPWEQEREIFLEGDRIAPKRKREEGGKRRAKYTPPLNVKKGPPQHTFTRTILAHKKMDFPTPMSHTL